MAAIAYWQRWAQANACRQQPDHSIGIDRRKQTPVGSNRTTLLASIGASKHLSAATGPLPELLRAAAWGDRRGQPVPPGRLGCGPTASMRQRVARRMQQMAHVACLARAPCHAEHLSTPHGMAHVGTTRSPWRMSAPCRLGCCRHHGGMAHARHGARGHLSSPLPSLTSAPAH
jgi:hypothetical protein